MQTFDARTPLGDLLDRLQLGMTIVITRRGKPVARLVPFSKPGNPAEVTSAVKRLRAFGKGIKLPKGLRIRDLIEEGRA
jgi:prevent-host-death family protein